MFRWVVRLSPLSLAVLPAVSAAQAASPSTVVQPVTVIASTPFSSEDLSNERLAISTLKLGAGDINRTGVPTLTGALLENSPSVGLNDVDGNVFSPNILFRGFTASPVAGTAEGLAVYVDGARFNDAFGDTVNWDLIPPEAILSATLEASNPVYGLNALGGSLDVRLKTGFDWQGANFAAYGGSYGRGAGNLEIGRRSGPFAFYVAADVIADQGFRYTSASNLYRIYGDIGWKDGPDQVSLGITGANTVLGNPGATPVQALNANIANIFTAPNQVKSQYFSLNAKGAHAFSGQATISGLAYFQSLVQRAPNGNTTEVAPCGDGGGLLCNPDGTVVSTIPAGPNPPTSIGFDGTHIWTANPNPNGITQNGTVTELQTS